MFPSIVRKWWKKVLQEQIGSKCSSRIVEFDLENPIETILPKHPKFFCWLIEHVEGKFNFSKKYSQVTQKQKSVLKTLLNFIY